nr:putative transmission-blocking target antigen s230 [Psychrobacter sp.]
MEKLTKIMKSDFKELHTSRKIERAKEFSKLTGMHVNHNEYPEYFFGDPEAKLVIVHLQPKKEANKADLYEGDFKYSDFEEYYHFYRNFGKLTPRVGDPKFDRNQISFIRPFNVIAFDDSKDNSRNLERVIDEKLQLQLMPFGSSKFPTPLIKATASKTDLLKPYVDMLLDTICEQDRDYIIFCGNIFETVLKDYILQEGGKKHQIDYKFYLPKDDGTTAKNKSRFSKIVLDFNGHKIPAGIAQTYHQQGLNMKEYGKKCCEIYDQA